MSIFNRLFKSKAERDEIHKVEFQKLIDEFESADFTRSRVILGLLKAKAKNESDRLGVEIIKSKYKVFQYQHCHICGLYYHPDNYELTPIKRGDYFAWVAGAQDVYNVPKFCLKCEHNYCLGCVKYRWLVKGSDFKCPDCGEEVRDQFPFKVIDDIYSHIKILEEQRSKATEKTDTEL